MRQHSEQAIDCQMQQDVSDYRDYDRHHQRMPLISTRAGHDSFKRKVEGIRHCNNKLYESRSAAGRHQRQQKFDALLAYWNLQYGLPATSLFSGALPAFFDSPRA